MTGDRNSVLVRTGSRDRSDALLYGILRILTPSRTERKHLKKAARGKRKDARSLKRLTGEKSRTDPGAVLRGLGEYFLFGKEAFYRGEAARERNSERKLAAFLKDAPKLDRVLSRSEKRARRDEKYSGRTAKIAAKESRKSEKKTARRTKRAFKRVDRYFRR